MFSGFRPDALEVKVAATTLDARKVNAAGGQLRSAIANRTPMRRRLNQDRNFASRRQCNGLYFSSLGSPAHVVPQIPRPL